jgi:hypothetical protein
MGVVRARSLTMGKLGGEVGPWVNFCGLGRLKSDGFTWCSPGRALPWSQATLSEPFLPTPPPPFNGPFRPHPPPIPVRSTLLQPHPRAELAVLSSACPASRLGPPTLHDGPTTIPPPHLFSLFYYPLSFLSLLSFPRPSASPQRGFPPL